MKERLIELVKKMASLKFIVLIVGATVLTITGIIDQYIWFACVGTGLGLREVSKKITDKNRPK